MTRATRPSFSSAFCVENRPRIEAICVGIWYDTMLCQSINPALSSAEGFSKINWLIMFMLRVSSAWRKSQQQIYHRLCHENAWKRIKNEKIELFCIRPVPIHQFWWMHSHSQFIPKNSECIQFTIHFEKKWIIQFIIHLKMNQFIFNSWNHATLFIFMRWFCLISCECRSARLLRNWRRFSRRFFRSRSSTKIEFRN